MKEGHDFVRSPHRTMVVLSFPVLLSLIAEPLTGLADTAFVARLGAVPLAALGVGTTALSSVFWIFNFLGIGSQTEVAQAEGRGDQRRARQISGLAISLAACFGLLLIVIGIPSAQAVAGLMGADGDLHGLAVRYMRFRLLGAPAVLATIAAFGTLRGLQDMRTPLWVAVSVNLLNILLDFLFIFGFGPLPPLGVAGAALASALSQWAGAAWVVTVVFSRLGMPRRLPMSELGRLIRIGGDLFVRTGLVTLFLVLTTRAATRIGADAGAAHQAIRQVWIFSALLLDAFAITGQSLVGYFVGSDEMAWARRVAWIVCAWSLGTGIAMGTAMWLGMELVVRIFVPSGAYAVFVPAWGVSALTQPVNSLSFATDGIHWGTGDFRFLRNAMAVASAFGVLGIWLINENGPHALTLVWIVTGGWITFRATFGILRIWPGIGKSPLRDDKPVTAASDTGI